MVRPTSGCFQAGAVALLGLLLAASPGWAQTPQQQRSQIQQQTHAQIYGKQLMTPSEIQAYQTRMRSLKTEQERNAFREEHRRQMQERARERGITLPDAPPAWKGPGAPSGAGAAGGMGMGGGPGQGQGRKK